MWLGVITFDNTDVGHLVLFKVFLDIAVLEGVSIVSGVVQEFMIA